jgi:ribosome-binding protein aMBF1 (putative translation factor)
MARAAVGWSTRDLAERANVGATTVNRFEVEARAPIKATLMAIRRALEDAGVEFTDGDGVRLRPKNA